MGRVCAIAVWVICMVFASSARASSTPDFDVYGSPAVGRVFLFHGLTGTREFVHDPTVAPLVNGLVDRGWQVMVPDEPYDHDPRGQGVALRDYFQHDATAGRAYRDAWSDHVRALTAAATSQFGAAPRTMMAGISWGGFHALLAACADPSVGAFAVHAPVVDPTALEEFADIPLDNLKLDDCVPSLSRRLGYISYGNADTRVGVTPQRNLVASIGAQSDRLTSYEFNGLGHDTPPESVAQILEWVQSTMPSPAPEPPRPVPAPTVAAPPPPAPVAVPVAPRRRCNAASHCTNVVRRGKFFHVYRLLSRHPRWVYVRPAA